MTTDCPEPTPPSSNATEEEWRAYFVAYAAYLLCLSEHEAETPISEFTSPFEAFATQANRFQNELP